MMVIGLDGLDYNDLMKYINHLKFFKKFKIRRLYIDIEPVHTIPVWTLLLSGKRIEEHGFIAHDKQVIDNRIVIKPAKRSEFKFKFIWDIKNWICLYSFTLDVYSNISVENVYASKVESIEDIIETFIKHYNILMKIRKDKPIITIFRIFDEAYHLHSKGHKFSMFEIYKIVDEYLSMIDDKIVILSDHGKPCCRKKYYSIDIDVHYPDAVIGANFDIDLPNKASEVFNWLLKL